jgi:hypothetical protein
LSTTQAAAELKDELLEHQRNFFKTAVDEGRNDSRAAVVFGSPGDKTSVDFLAEILSRHKIEFYQLARNISSGGKKFEAEDAFVVPLSQPQYRMIRAIFETTTEFNDSLFYDVSSWTLPLAFNLDYKFLDAKTFQPSLLGPAYEERKVPDILPGRSKYAYVFKWEDYFAPKALYRLLKEDLIIKISTEPFAHESTSFPRGSIIIPVSNQPKSVEEIHGIMDSIQRNYPFTIYAINTGYTEGLNLGSQSFLKVDRPKAALLVENGVRSYDAGEVWHLLDERFDMQLTLLPIRNLNTEDISRYNKMIMVDGNYRSINNSGKDALSYWLEKGGTLIATKRANEWLTDQGFMDIQFRQLKNDSVDRREYGQLREYLGAQVTGGAILETDVDLTHPLGFGLTSRSLPVFYNGKTVFEKPGNAYAYPVVFKEKPLLSGYISEENMDNLKSSPAVIISRKGKGQIISFAFNPNFRAFWYGTNRIFLNALFFDNLIESRSMDDCDP